MSGYTGYDAARELRYAEDYLERTLAKIRSEIECRDGDGDEFTDTYMHKVHRVGDACREAYVKTMEGLR